MIGVNEKFERRQERVTSAIDEHFVQHLEQGPEKVREALWPDHLVVARYTHSVVSTECGIVQD